MRSQPSHQPHQPSDPNRVIESHLNSMSLDIVKNDNVLYDSGNVDVMLKHARDIASRANQIVKILDIITN